MARAETPTWLSLDEWAQIIGINPLHFNGFSSTKFSNNACGEVFFQYDWQHSDRIGRETIAMAIREAEEDISREVGFNLIPDWTTEERLQYPRPGFPGAYGMNGQNVRTMWKSVEALRGHLISGGIKTKAQLQLVAPVVFSDVDGDGFNETATVSVAVTITDTNQVHVYYAGHAGADEWEIRPIKVSIAAGVATITFKAWLIPDANQLEALNAQPLDGDIAASYESTVDVYRVYNDPSTQLQFMWEYNEDLNCCGSCVACQFSTQAGCFHLRDARLGIVVPVPGSWNATDEAFDSQELSVCRDPDQIRLWYYSGWMNNRLARPYVEMDPFWKWAVAYYAASKFDRPVCGCSNINEFIDKWRRDAAFSSQEEGGWTMTSEMASNKLGTTMGALYAYRCIHKNGVRIIK